MAKANAALLFFLAACAKSPEIVAKPASSVPAAEPVPKSAAHDDDLALFDELVAMVRRYHLFAPQAAKNLGKTWDDELPRLRAEFAGARDREALLVALWHFGNSLHDVHCQFHPKERGPRLRLGLRLCVEKKGDRFVLYVERVTDKTLAAQIAPGDVVEEIDGVPAAKLFTEHDLASNMNAPENVALEIARYLTSRRAATTLTRAGTTSAWKLRPRDDGSATRASR